MMKKNRPLGHLAYSYSISMAILSAALLAFAAGLGKHLTALGSLQLVIFIRFFFPFLLMLVGYLVFIRQRFEVANIKPHALRAISAIGAQYCFFYVLAHGNVLLGTLLYSTNGLFTPLLTWLFFRIKVTPQTIGAIFIAFLGVGIALGPWKSILSPLSLIGLLSGFLSAISQVMQHNASKKDNKSTVNLMLFGLCSLLAFPLIFTHPHWDQSLTVFIQPTLPIISLILLFSIASICIQTSKTAAFKNVQTAAHLAPFFYSVVIFSAIIDDVVYHIRPHFHTLLGIALIIIGSIIMSIPRKNPRT